MVIVHAPHGHEIAEVVKPLPGEFVVDPWNGVDDTCELDGYLKTHGIRTLLYAGYASNCCVIFKPAGIQKMRERGYEIILVRDCTIGVETPQSFADKWVHRMAIRQIENNWAETTTLEDLETAFNNTH